MNTRLSELFAARQLVGNLTMRELRTRYRNTWLGWLWSLANPLTSVVIYTFVFGTLLNAQAPAGDPSGVDAFALFLLCGLIPFSFFTNAVGAGLNSLLAGADLIRKVAFPRESLVLARILDASVQFGIEICLLIVVFLVAGSPLLPWLPVTLLLVAFLGLFSFGLSLILSVLTVRFRDIPHFWGILTTVWFFATPIVYPQQLLDDHVEGPLREVLRLNPMRYFVEAFRQTLYSGRGPTLKMLVALAVVSSCAVLVGWFTFGRLSADLAEEL